MSVRDALTAELTVAMRAKDKPVVSALRSALSALANAEAVPAHRPAGETSPHVAGAVPGVGATETARRILTDAEMRAIVSGEIEDWERHAATLAEAGRAAESDGALRAAVALRTAALRPGS